MLHRDVRAFAVVEQVRDLFKCGLHSCAVLVNGDSKIPAAVCADKRDAERGKVRVKVCDNTGREAVNIIRVAVSVLVHVGVDVLCYLLHVVDGPLSVPDYRVKVVDLLVRSHRLVVEVAVRKGKGGKRDVSDGGIQLPVDRKCVVAA